ncbi:MAG: hypothetical protein Q9162_005700, partial [Coniocarpon cinnabarinum]
MTAKGPGSAQTHDGSQLRIGILHGRWNSSVITSLVSGAKKSLLASGVQEHNIVTQSIPGSYELPFAVQRMITTSQTTTSTNIVSAAADLLGSSTDLTATSQSQSHNQGSGQKSLAEGGGGGIGGPLDAVIAIGVLIKGSTMHFEYIADAVSHGLMRVQLDTGTPVIFGVLTCLDEEQAMTRAGLRKPEEGKE